MPESKVNTNRSSAHRTPLPKRKGKSGLVWSAVFVAALLGFGIAPRLRQENHLETIQKDVTDSPPSVDAVSPTESSPIENLELPSSVQAIQETTIYARTAGYLHQRFVDIGSRVKSGQLLATIESPEVDEQLSESQENVAKEQAAGQQSVADEYRLQAGVVSSRAQVSESRSVLEGSLADVANSRAKLTEARGALSSARARLQQLQKKQEGMQASLAQYKTKEQLADKTYRRWKELAAGGAVSGQDLDETEASYQTSLSAVTEAQASVESAKADVVAAQADVQSREGDVSAAQAQIASQEQKVDSAKSAVLASESNVKAAQASVQAGRASVSAAQASIRSSQSSLRRVGVLRGFEEVRAPFSGVITARNVDVGSLIGAGSGNTEGATDPQSTVPRTGMFGIAQTDMLRVQVNVPQNYIPDIHVGDSATVTSPQLPNLSAVGRVFDTAGALDAKSRTLLVEVRVPNPDGKLIPGMYAQVDFKLHHKTVHIRLASDALIIDAKGVRVAEITPDSKIHFQDVTLGRDLGREVEILSGLELNSRVVENPSDDLVEGEKVTVNSPAKS